MCVPSIAPTQSLKYSPHVLLFSTPCTRERKKKEGTKQAAGPSLEKPVRKLGFLLLFLFLNPEILSPCWKSRICLALLLHHRLLLPCGGELAWFFVPVSFSPALAASFSPLLGPVLLAANSGS
ncbi:hypothetical protein SLEP1_g33938 [Rubroshorea leprosula]|uniref:Uncharacterized protein n=1 Tax=Rubroshorea leprosula TaxID=152421 RepID=A0AAV5KII9_9ROSI|nr:hypothetical protein SLEP1_g33938 [Rubroshorea leprosula]